MDVAECGVNEMAEAHSHALLTEWGGEGVVSNLHSRSQVDRQNVSATYASFSCCCLNLANCSQTPHSVKSGVIATTE